MFSYASFKFLFHVIVFFPHLIFYFITFKFIIKKIGDLIVLLKLLAKEKKTNIVKYPLSQHFGTTEFIFL